MRGVYKIRDTIASFTTGDIVSIEAPANEVCELHHVHIAVQNPTDGEDLDISAFHCSVKPSGGSSTITPAKSEPGDQASGATVRTVPTGETKDAAPFLRESFPAETGWHYTPTPEERDYIEAGGSIVLAMNSSITSGTLVVSATWREIG